MHLSSITIPDFADLVHLFKMYLFGNSSICRNFIKYAMMCLQTILVLSNILQL
ncbi:hypothetical protein LguiA_013393 [Lonicera macranthoides]